MTGRLHSVETLGTVDGPGRRFVVFLQGCPYRCRYCHNPDSWSKEKGTPTGSEELFRKVDRLRNFYLPGGGVTVTGGEPLLQPEFVGEFLERCRRGGYHTVIDTAGAPLTEPVKKALRAADLVLLDIKAVDPQLHLKLTGADREIAREVARFLDEEEIPFRVRHVLVPGWTDSEEQLLALGEYLSGLKKMTRLELLPFHQMGSYKWEELGLRYPFADLPEAARADVERAAEILRECGVTVYL